MMSVKYFFDYWITEEEKIILKTITHNIQEYCANSLNRPDDNEKRQHTGIFFGKQKFRPSYAYVDEIFSNCSNLFYILIDEITKIGDLTTIICFLMSQVDKECSLSEHYLCVNKENSDDSVTQLIITKYTYDKISIKKYAHMCNYDSTKKCAKNCDCEMSSSYLNTYKGKESIVKLHALYLIDIINDTVKTFKIQMKYRFTGIENIPFVMDPQYATNVFAYKRTEKDNILGDNEEHYDLIDLYIDYCSKNNNEVTE